MVVHCWIISQHNPYTNLDNFKVNIARMLHWSPWGTGAGQPGSTQNSPSIRHLPKNGDRPQAHRWIWFGGVCDQAGQGCGELDQSCCSVAGARLGGPGGLTKGPGPWTVWGNPEVGVGMGRWAGRGKHSGPCQNCGPRAILPKWKRFQCSANFVK